MTDEDRTWSGSLDVSGRSDPLRAVVEELEPGRRDDDDDAVVEVWTTVFVEVVGLG